MRTLNIAAIALTTVLAVPAIAQAADNVYDACAAVKMTCTYNARYDLIDEIYRATKQVMFDKSSTPYPEYDAPDAIADKSDPPRWYSGTSEQNERLARNILANRELFSGGKLTEAAAKKWKLVK